MLRGESNVATVPAIGGYGVEDIYLGEFSPHELLLTVRGIVCVRASEGSKSRF